MKKIDIIYNELTEKLQAAGHFEEIKAIENSSLGAATGSEALMGQSSYLLALRHSNPAAFQIIQNEINEHVKYCKENGLLIH